MHGHIPQRTYGSLAKDQRAIFFLSLALSDKLFVGGFGKNQDAHA